MFLFLIQPFRYGIIKLDDLKRDLRYWETLLVSSMMQRPFETVIEPKGQALEIVSL